MDHPWNEEQAARFVAERAPCLGEDLALRLYSARLIGSQPSLVLHGGGNVSLKRSEPDLYGEERAVLRVKGSGWDLHDLEAEGLPALDLEGLRRMRRLSSLSDEAMVKEFRRLLRDPAAPNPSVETLLHAFLPHPYVDHSHADAILALSDLEDGEERIEAALGERVITLPFVMPGFRLAQAVAAAYEEHPDVEGIVLHHHGLFTFGASARESYERHLSLVDAAEQYLEAARARSARSFALPESCPEGVAATRAARVMPLLRRELAARLPAARRPLLRRLAAPELRSELDGADARDRYCTPPLTPDHCLRLRSLPCWLPVRWEDPSEEALAASVSAALAEWAEEDTARFRRGCAARGERRELDHAPRLILIPGCGPVVMATDRESLPKAADLALHNLRTKAAARPLGPFRGLDELDLFDMEYWPLEQAKLGRRPAPELAGRVALVTGGGGAIGEGVGTVLAEAGAIVALLDLDRDRTEAAAERIRASSGPESAFAVVADVTDASALDAAFREILDRVGGLDVLVPNAGVAAVGPLADLDPADYRRVVEVNQTGVFLTLRAGARLFRLQGLGGSVVLISTKNVPEPGASFGAYSSSKAGAHQLARVAALELAPAGVRVNMVCPDAVFAHDGNPSGLWAAVGPERARSKGLDPAALQEHYVQKNLLKTRVEATDVGRAVLFLAARATCTTGAWLPVDGGLPGTFPR